MQALIDDGDPAYTRALLAPLLDAFPALRPRFEQDVAEALDEGEDYSLDQAFADGVSSLVFREVFDGRASARQRQAFFSWLEGLAESGDDSFVRNFVITEIMELIGNEARWVKVARRDLGPASAELFRRAEAGISRTTNLPFP